MRSRSMFLMGLSGAVLLLAGCSLGPVMIAEHESPYDFDKTLTLVQENAKETGWTIPKVHDFQKSLVKHGQPDPGKLVVVKLCNPEIATRMFGSDERKYVSVMAPCSISIYEKADGKTYVSAMRMGLMGKLMGGEIGKVMADIEADDQRILNFIEH